MNPYLIISQILNPLIIGIFLMFEKNKKLPHLSEDYGNINNYYSLNPLCR